MPTSSDFFLIGAGGHAKVVLEVLQRTESNNISVWDDDVARDAELCLGLAIETPISIDKLPRLGHVAIGSNAVRRRFAVAVVDSGRALQAVVHPAASVSSHSVIADGAFVAANAVVGPDARVGRAAIINHGAIIDHDCRVGAFSHIAPSVTLGGGVTIGEDCLIGVGAIIMPGLVIADRVVIGAGAVLTRSVNIEGAVLKGVPAR